jgi:hypothetical protein
MPRRRGRRFVLEVLFLAGVAAAASAAELKPGSVIVLMAIAWVVVALLEWTSWLDEPHYGRGLPPRYYVPQTALPPPRAVTQGYGYVPPRRPAPGPSPDDAPTFDEPADEWGVTLAEWPELEDETAIAIRAELEEPAPTQVVPLPPVLGLEETVEHVVVFPDERVLEEDEPTEDPSAVPHIAEVVVATAATGLAQPERARVVSTPGSERPPGVLAPPLQVKGVVLHRVDPLGGLARGRFRFRAVHDEATVEVDDGPPPCRRLSERVLEQATAVRP